MRILVVDDEPLISRLVEVALTAAEVEVATAPTAGEGIELAVGSRPDVILLDLHLPDAEGEIVLDAVHQVPDWEPRIFIFSALDALRVRSIVARHRVEVLPKPFELDDLRSRLVGATPAG